MKATVERRALFVRRLTLSAAYLFCAHAMAQEQISAQNATGNQFEMLFEDDPGMRMIALANMAKSIWDDPSAKPYLCAPAGVTFLQAAKVESLYIANHPELLNFKIHDLAYAALMSSFPCMAPAKQ